MCPAARFNSPDGVAVDGAGNLYVTDSRNHTIRKITPAGVVTTLAGSVGLSGSEDGVGAAARFGGPSGLAVDSVGNIFVVDTGNETIRKITPAGLVTTLAGTAGLSGSADGTGAAARFNYPQGVAVDGEGNVFVTDAGNDTIRKITPAGVVTTLAGTAGFSGSLDGTGDAARFDSPRDVVVDGAGNILVGDWGGKGAIRKITPAGVVTTLAGTEGLVGSADGLALDGAGNVFVADSINNTIQEVTVAGVVTTLAGTAGLEGSADGAGAAARFNNPCGVAVDGAGNVFIADARNNTIRKVTPAGAVTTLAGTADLLSGSADGAGAVARFDNPSGVAVDGTGSLFVVDFGNNTIRKVTPAGVVTTLAGTAGLEGNADGTGADARFYQPRGLAVDGAGNLFVADVGNSTIRKITPDGVVTSLAGAGGPYGSADGTGAAARFSMPTDVAVDGAGNVFVADSNNGTIRKITPSGVVSTFAGSAGQYGSKDGTGAAARFAGPIGLAADGVGNLFVVDFGNNTIRKVTPGGVVSTLAGSAGQYGSTDGTGAEARFYYPSGVAVDGAGNVFVADDGNNAIRKITASGVVTTIVGVAAQTSVGDFPGPLPASLVGPTGVAVDSSGTRLYITLPNAVMVAVLSN
jgi:sugar lactone lactonase YvrE